MSEVTAAGAPRESAFEAATYRKIAFKLLPLLFAGYFLAILDRVNVGFAKLQMASDLSLSDTVYGFGAGVFFFGYFLFELPSNLIQAKVGARRWIARIMMSWGAISAMFMFLGDFYWGPIPAMLGVTQAEFSFYLLRFTLGVAEAGFFPGVIFYLTYWFPSARRGHVIAMFIIAIPLASAIGSPVSGMILQFLDGSADLRGWQWLFLLEGIPTVLLGFVVLAKLPDGPRSAEWLEADELELVEARLAEDEADKAGNGQRHAVREIFLDWRIWALALADFLRAMVNNALNFWMPTLIQELGIPREQYLKVGMVTAIPWCLAGIIMVLAAKNSDRTGERRWHLVLAMVSSTIGLLILAIGPGAILSLVALTMVAAGAMTWLALFWTIPTAFLSGLAAAGGIAWINALAQLGGFVGPDMVGRVRDASGGDTTWAFVMLAGCAAGGAVLSFILAKPVARTR